MILGFVFSEKYIHRAFLGVYFKIGLTMKKLKGAKHRVSDSNICLFPK